MVASLFCAPPFEGDTIVSYSDIVYNPNHVYGLIESQHDIVVTADAKWRQLWEARFENPLEDAESFSFHSAELLSIGERVNDMDEIEAQFMGLIKVSRDGWQTMFDVFQSLSNDDQDKLDMTSLIQIMLSRKNSIGVHIVSGGWCEADSDEDIELYEKLLKTNKWTHDWRGNL